MIDVVKNHKKTSLFKRLRLVPPGVAMIQRLYDRKSLSTIFQKFLYLHIYPVMFANCSADENFKIFQNLITNCIGF